MLEQLQAIFTNVVPILTLIGWLLAIYLLLLWAASVLWAYRDIRARSEDVFVQVLAVLLVWLIPFAGIFLHMILRPRQTLAEQYERALQEQYLRRDLEEQYVCPHCQRGVEPDFVFCPHCHTPLRRRCIACDRVIDLTWSICPYCGEDGSRNAARSGYRRETQQVELFEQ